MYIVLPVLYALLITVVLILVNWLKLYRNGRDVAAVIQARLREVYRQARVVRPKGQQQGIAERLA